MAIKRSITKPISRKAPAVRTLVLRGGPFHNIATVRDIIKDCVPQLSQQQVADVVERANCSGFVELLVSDDMTTRNSCTCLIENGMYASIDSVD